MSTFHSHIQHNTTERWRRWRPNNGRPIPRLTSMPSKQKRDHTPMHLSGDQSMPYESQHFVCIVNRVRPAHSLRSLFRKESTAVERSLKWRRQSLFSNHPLSFNHHEAPSTPAQIGSREVCTSPASRAHRNDSPPGRRLPDPTAERLNAAQVAIRPQDASLDRLITAELKIGRARCLESVCAMGHGQRSPVSAK